jgi:hypothetical protein
VATALATLETEMAEAHEADLNALKASHEAELQRTSETIASLQEQLDTTAPQTGGHSEAQLQALQVRRSRCFPRCVVCAARIAGGRVRHNRHPKSISLDLRRDRCWGIGLLCAPAS